MKAYFSTHSSTISGNPALCIMSAISAHCRSRSLSSMSSSTSMSNFWSSVSWLLLLSRSAATACLPLMSALRLSACCSLTFWWTMDRARISRSSISVCVLRILRRVSSNICKCPLSWSLSSRNLGASLRLGPSTPLCFLYSSHCWVNSVPMTEMGSASSSTEASMATHATSLPSDVTGTSSPYPTVISVTMTHQKLSGMDLNGLSVLSHPATRVLPSSNRSTVPASAEASHVMSVLRLYRLPSS
mmetsp:Transcript_30978/g.77574  ORF Transcript_30978/g.77574 Transcript_30978/m.77574 type:complete len:244 (-) Transcript_30978:1478-2209(-)